MKIEKTLAALSLEEKASLSAGADMWSTPAIEAHGVPALRMTDGPNGARGAMLPGQGSGRSTCIPCGSALGASWNPALVERVGALLGEEAREKQCRVLLAPTINLHRSPLGGRNFECLSEDPVLSGRVAAAYVRGVQSRGVAATPKHFVANDAEFQRQTIDSRVDERSLREVYLVPFEMAVREGGALAIMTAYNRLNGAYCTEDHWLLTELLKHEWGFEGLVMTDWFGAGTTVDSAVAGLDVQMPGPGRFFGAPLAEAVRSGAVSEPVLDGMARRVLTVIDRLAAWDDAPGEPASEDRADRRALAREAAGEGTVLLRNEGLLPLDRERVRKIAVLGPNAARPHIMGGGSASFRPHYRKAPLDGLRELLGDACDIAHEPGCTTDKTMPLLTRRELETPDGEAGMAVEFFDNPRFEGEPVFRRVDGDSRVVLFGAVGNGVPDRNFSVRARARFTPRESGAHRFALAQAGRARLFVDGACVLDGHEDPPPNTGVLGLFSGEMETRVELRAGEPVELVAELVVDAAGFLTGMNVGHRDPQPEDLLERAVAAARASEVAIVVVGTSDEWESEGHDRESMQLPGAQDALVSAVAAANPNTVVVVNAGAPIAMPWADEVSAIVVPWLGGQEMASALAEILFGLREPAGRLPTTLPERLEHNPSYGNFPGEGGELRYGEGLLVGHRWYEARGLPVRFPFGHGLSYSEFEIGAPELSSDRFEAGGTLTVRVPVRNTGSRRAAEVVQLYLAPEAPLLFRPVKQLVGFAKLWLEPGEESVAEITLEDRAFAYWDPGFPQRSEVTAKLGPMGGVFARNLGPERAPGWYLDDGVQVLELGRSVADIVHRHPLRVLAAGPLAR